MNKNQTFKVILAGDQDVAKPALLSHFEHIKKNTNVSIGIDFFIIELQVDGQKYVLQLWNFSTWRKFRFLMKSYILGSRGAVLIFDLGRPATLESLGEWVEICRENEPDLPFLLIGVKPKVKLDVNLDENYISSFLEEFDIHDYVKISENTRENVLSAFKLITRRILGREGAT